MYYNSGGLEIFYDWQREPIEILPRFLFDIIGLHPSSKSILEVSDVSEYFRRAKNIVFLRRYALGDVLMLLPVLRQFKETYSAEITLATNPDRIQMEFIRLFNVGVADKFVSSMELRNGYEIGVLLDGLLERDHTIKEYSLCPRVDIYRKFLGLSLKEDVIWNPVPSPVGNSGVVFCSSGQFQVKSLPEDVAGHVYDLLCRKYKKVLWISESRRVAPSLLISELCNARVCVTMDTAPLWMAHFTGTPVVLITGPTRGRERLAYHPLRPDGVAEISLSKQINCEPCFERREACSGRVDCLKNIDKKSFGALVMKAVEDVAWKTH